MTTMRQRLLGGVLIVAWRAESRSRFCSVGSERNGTRIFLRPEFCWRLRVWARKLSGMTDMARPRIAVVFTGGTISMRVDALAGGAVPALSGEEILALVPGLEKIAAVRVVEFARVAGPHITPVRMLELARVVEAQLADATVQGVVITHGTDTLEETAYLLDLVLDSEKPVVLVGSMRNGSELGFDGPANLRSAVRVAVEPAARGLGVLVVMNDQLLAAAEATKTHTEAVDTFQSRDFGALGIVDKDRVIVTRRRAARGMCRR